MSENNETQNNQPAPHQGGVKTEAGKEISKYNAQKHSILRETFTEYEEIDLSELYNELSEEFQPKGRIEEILMEMLASDVIRMQRVSKAEAEYMKAALHPDGFKGLKFEKDSYIPKITDGNVERWALYSRYQTSIENRFFRKLAFLHQLKLHGQNQKTTR